MNKLQSTTLAVLARLMPAFAPAPAAAKFHYGHIYLSAFQAKGPYCRNRPANPVCFSAGGFASMSYGGAAWREVLWTG